MQSFGREVITIRPLQNAHVGLYNGVDGFSEQAARYRTEYADVKCRKSCLAAFKYASLGYNWRTNMHYTRGADLEQ